MVPVLRTRPYRPGRGRTVGEGRRGVRHAVAPLLVAVLTTAVLVGGCSGDGEGADFPGAPSLPASHLDPCPASTGQGADLPELTLPCLGSGADVSLQGL